MKFKIHSITPHETRPFTKEAKEYMSNKVMGIEAYRQYNKSQYRTKSKYKNKTQVYNGRKYDSIREANHAEELDWRIKHGEIAEVIPQYKISLDVNGHHITNYYVDFKCILKDGSVEFHEVKGFSTDVFLLKKKLFLALINEIEEGARYLIIK